MPVDSYPTPPPLAEFSDFHIPDGRVWTRSDDWDTHDGGCVAVATHRDGWVAVADTKNPGAQPLIFNASEWADFTSAIRANKL